MVEKYRISIVIPTHNRADSLRITLNCLENMDWHGVRAEIVVVDNGSTDTTPIVVEEYGERLPVRYLYEPTAGVWGKSHALNRALDEGRLGDIIVVLDDDMSPHTDWLQGVAAISDRWPDKDIFTGNNYVIWPTQSVPDWVLEPAIQVGIFSLISFGEKDEMLKRGTWFAGGHFWFRSRVLFDGKRFEDVWRTEPAFMLRLTEEGYEGVYGADAVAGHRIQPDLLNEQTAWKRAVKEGRTLAEVRLIPYRECVKAARKFRRHPLIARLFCIVMALKWGGVILLAKCHKSPTRRFGAGLRGIREFVYYRELLRLAGRLSEYRIGRRGTV